MRRIAHPRLMRARPLVIVAVAVVLLGAGAAALLTGGDERTSRPGVPPPVREDSQVPRERPAPARPHGARLLRRTQLRRRPGGPVVKALGRRTEYGSPRVLAVVARRGRWLGVLTEHVRNSRAAWIPAANVELLHEPYRLDVDLSRRLLTVRREGRVVRRVRVATGRPGNDTPTGRFAVTDSLRIGKGSAAYGCCALALTGRQPNVPQGWTGGDRIAIHGTSNEATIGTPASGGCLRARDADMRWLMRRITLGASVRIRE